MDQIKLSVSGNSRIEEILKNHEAQILKEILGTKAEYGQIAGYSKEWNINGEAVTLGVEKQ